MQPKTSHFTLNAIAVSVALMFILQISPLALGGEICDGSQRFGHWSVTPIPVDVPGGPAPVPPRQIIPETMAVDPEDPSRMYIADVKNVLRSDDAGCSWTRVLGLGDLLSAPADLLGAGEFGNIFSVQVAQNGSVFVAISELSRKGAAGTSGRMALLKSADQGASWSNIFTSPPGFGSAWDGDNLQISPSVPQTMYLFTYTWAAQGKLDLLFVSTDGGATWITQPLRDNRVAHIKVDPLKADRLWGWRVNTSSVSNDGGKTWSAIGPDLQTGDNISAMDVKALPGGDVRLVITTKEGHMFWSDDSGGSWQSFSTPGSLVVSELAHGANRNSLVANLGGKNQLGRFSRRTGAWTSITPINLEDQMKYLTVDEAMPRPHLYGIVWSEDEQVAYLFTFSGRF